MNLFLGNHNCNYVCRRCLEPYVFIKHKQQCDEQDITSVRLSKERISLILEKTFS